MKFFGTELTDEIREKKMFSIGTYAVLGGISLVMTLLNVFQNKGLLTVCTAVFSLLCIVNILLTFTKRHLSSVARIMFAVEVVAMFTFFLITGNPEGFSAIWLAMLPSLGMFFFDRYKGTALCVVMFLILIFFFWTEAGQSVLHAIQTNPEIVQDKVLESTGVIYTKTFMTRFPILFVAFHVLAYFLETLRSNAYKEMRRLQDYYQDLSIRDQLTGMLNRQGMYSALDNEEKYHNTAKIGVSIFDIDHFKEINDTYGHNVGDRVLKEFSHFLKSELNTLICRWGGEEFVCIATEEEIQNGMLDIIRLKIENHEFSAEDEKFKLTISIGYVITDDYDLNKIDRVIGKADEALYHAKNTGRNKVVNFDEIGK